MRTPNVNITYHKHVLNNGLTLIVHEDHKAPIVAVDIWYHVGSKNEHPGITGFAHLFEHLMFSGSAHYDDEYFRPFEEVGATDMNGTTSEDRTNFFENVPTPALDLALWMESDRMGHLLGAINQGKLDEQRGVVKNEKRQRENTPYGKVWQLLPEATYPPGHPYSWSVIGSMQDLDAASLDDVHDWFRRYYGAANAVLVVAGDVACDDVIQRVEHYFGAIPAGEPVVRHHQWIAPRSEEKRQSMQDRVPQPRVYKVWNVPPRMSDAETDLEIAASLLAGSKNSRLYQRLVYRDQIATDVVAGVNDCEIGSQFLLWATASPGVELETVEQTVNEEMAAFLQHGPTDEELERVRTRLGADFARGTEHIGGFGGKADILASSEIYGGSPDAYQRELERLRQVAPAEIAATAQAWLANGAYVLCVEPYAQHATTTDTVDRSAPPQVRDLPDLSLPEVQKFTLKNGIPVRFARRPGAPVVELRTILDAGYAADAFTQAGTANMALSMLDEGTASHSSLQLDSELEELGAHFSANASLDACSVSLSALTDTLGPAMTLYADMLRNPDFPAHELQRLQQQTLARIAQEKSRPTGLAMRILPPLLYGEGHPYSLPLTGSGSEAAVAELSREDMHDFHRRWIRPDNATVVAVGDCDASDLEALLNRHLGDWQAPSTAKPEKQLTEVANAHQDRVFLMDRPGAEQSVILAGRIAPPRNHPEHHAMTTLNAIVGGMFTSRLNLNLREDKHWSYGARSLMLETRGQAPLIMLAPVEREQTATSMIEIQRDINAIMGDRPATAEELDAAKKNLTLKLPGEHETAADLAGTLAESVIFDLPDNYYNAFVEQVRRLKGENLMRAADLLFRPGGFTWVVVGDVEKIGAPMRDLGWGEVTELDADGQPLS